MGGKKLLSRRTRQHIGAAIAAGVTSFIAMNTINKASAQDCGLQDAMDWQLALHDQQIEQSPEHISSSLRRFWIPVQTAQNSMTLAVSLVLRRRILERPNGRPAILRMLGQ